ncbi:MAG: hypothetical protein AB7E80_08715 [Hyphomicrobiaceae bacterium]
MKTAVWFILIALATFAAFATLSRTAPSLDEMTRSVSKAAELPQLPQAVPGMPDVSMPAIDLKAGGIDWLTLLAGVLIGIAATLAGRIAWLDLPRRALRWLILNEHNFYKLGLAAACLGVLLFY